MESSVGTATSARALASRLERTAGTLIAVFLATSQPTLRMSRGGTTGRNATPPPLGDRSAACVLSMPTVAAAGRTSSMADAGFVVPRPTCPVLPITSRTEPRIGSLPTPFDCRRGEGAEGVAVGGAAAVAVAGACIE